MTVRKPFWRRFGWLLIIWTGSVVSLALVALFFRTLMFLAGFKS